jgi:hypothetical protein
MPETPAERALRGRLAAHTSWANTSDRTARTEAARQAFRDRFEREVDPDGVLDPVERAKRAEHARQAYYTRLALRSVQSRRRAAESRRAAKHYDELAAKASAELAEVGLIAEQATDDDDVAA